MLVAFLHTQAATIANDDLEGTDFASQSHDWLQPAIMTDMRKPDHGQRAV